jgi:hypothetical protein
MVEDMNWSIEYCVWGPLPQDSPTQTLCLPCMLAYNKKECIVSWLRCNVLD